ncbi:MAG: glycogen/starch/alpha-glucan phosphorylase [Cetobacterium sp.]|uniref:glycogen/starch/alpha-glucan phosphorylase n=1 Tax=unclassified Cetobacterium TaxID=2630983 RepID=UPI00163BA378|nr:glycogen/starch/alpha-glucan phosphorylase [Cetobacterium sp. 2A]MBC2855912.1 glycogen/starch/alpha-glucan phosphorylase [Cetobacterium sp. 2A]
MIMMREKMIGGILKNLKVDFAKRLNEADNFEIYQAASKTVLEYFSENWTRSNEMYEKGKNMYYFSAEFLMGRSLGSNLVNLGLFNEVEELFKDIGLDYNLVESIEEDGGLGNGGLGRLAACFLDSLATLNLPGHGYGIRYRNGIFKQSIDDGFQVEHPINWIKFQAAWSIPRYSDQVIVHFQDMDVKAIPYDTPIIGYGTDNINTLRLWEAHPIEDLDIQAFNDQKYDESVRVRNRVKDISRILYPNDSTTEGKKLRLRQQYFFVSASLQDIVRKYKKNISSNFDKFPDFVTIQLNDTHPVVAIPELMRILMDEESLSWKKAFNICSKVFAYTNHTILAEALEKWWINFYKELTPRVAEIMIEMDKKWKEELAKLYPDDVEKQNRMMIIQNDLVNMAWIAICVCHAVNGVAELHTEILKYKELKDWQEIFPSKIQNKTNGITQRRWVAVSNKPLTKLINNLIGNKWIVHCDELKKLEHFQNDLDVLNRFLSIKREKKQELADFIEETQGIEINPNSIFDVHVKRIHEYKRQVMNVLHILDLYYRMKDGKCGDFYPTTFIFAGKAAPGYFRAKGIIKLINEVARLVNNDGDVNDKIKVVFIEDFKVSVGEKIYPATDVSVQISTAGKEASGTGNMKFMMNGALTLGTYDGANVEIIKEAGEENAYIFGLRVEEIDNLKKNGYDPKYYYENTPGLKKALDSLIDGTLSDGGTGMFSELYNSILYGTYWHTSDQYFILKDFEEFRKIREVQNRDYLNQLNWAKKAWINIANSGKFSSDRTILEYSKDIWKIEPKRV